MTRDTEYGSHNPQSPKPVTEPDVFGDPETFWNSLAEKDQRALYDVYVANRLEADTSSDVFGVVQSMNNAAKSNLPQQHIESLAADKFGPPPSISKGEMFRRDSKSGKKSKPTKPDKFRLVDPSRRPTPPPTEP